MVCHVTWLPLDFRRREVGRPLEKICSVERRREKKKAWLAQGCGLVFLHGQPGLRHRMITAEKTNNGTFFFFLVD